MPFNLVPFLLLFIPILEIAVFILVGGEIGVVATLGLILLTAIIGSILLRVQGFSALNRIQLKMQAEEMPGEEMVNGVMILVAGVLLLTPGFVTDAVGFLLFFPPFRRYLWRLMGSRIIMHSAGHPYRRRPAEDNVVDLDPSEFSEKANPDSPWIDRN